METITDAETRQTTYGYNALGQRTSTSLADGSAKAMEYDAAGRVTKFDLPSEFLKKWIQVSGEKELTDQEAADEFEKSEKGLRYQLIEGKIIKENDLQVQFDELKEFAKGFIKSQMAQYGQLNPLEEELDNIAARVMSNQDEVKRLSEQLMSQKLLSLYKEKANLKTKEISYENFVKEVYG